MRTITKMSDAERIRRRIEAEAGVTDLADILADRLSPTDLHSLLLDVYRRRSERRNAAELFAEYRSNRFVQPGGLDARLLAEWDRTAFGCLPEGYGTVDLSPLCPLGTCSVVAGLSQNKSVVSARNLEVVSDATNVLALECAARRRELIRRNARSADRVRLASSHRLVRPEFSSNPQMRPHFRLFCLCTAGRDTGSNRFEIESAVEHIGFHLRALQTFLGCSPQLVVSLTDLTSGTPSDAMGLRLQAVIAAEFPLARVEFDQSRSSGRGYYGQLCFKIHAIVDDQRVELADGGDVGWTQKLLSSAKERLFISGIGSERVCDLHAITQT